MLSHSSDSIPGLAQSSKATACFCWPPLSSHHPTWTYYGLILVFDSLVSASDSCFYSGFPSKELVGTTDTPFTSSFQNTPAKGNFDDMILCDSPALRALFLFAF
jgi:hypothetical protein